MISGGGANISAGEIVFDYITGSDPAATIGDCCRPAITAGCGIPASSVVLTPRHRGLGWIDDTVNNKVIVAYALYGNSNLDGTVNGDLNAVLANYNKTGGIWYQGDFNYDGTVNGADLNTVLANYNGT